MRLSQARKIDGICFECKEHCSLDRPCCGAAVYAEGHTYSPDDLWDDSCGACIGTGISPTGPVEGRCSYCKGKGIVPEGDDE